MWTGLHKEFLMLQTILALLVALYQSSDEGLTFEMSASEFPYRGQLTLTTQLEKNYAVPLHHNFLRNLPTIFIMFCDKDLFWWCYPQSLKDLGQAESKANLFLRLSISK